MKLSELVEKGKESFLSKLVKEKTADNALPVIEAEFDRILYIYNENCKSESLKQAASNMLQTARMSAAFINSDGETKVWEAESAEETVNKNKPFLFWLMMIIGLAAAICMIIKLILEDLEVATFPIILGLFAISIIMFFAAGIIFGKPKKDKKSKNNKTRKIEIFIDPEKIYRSVYNMTVLIDKNLDEIEAEEEWEKRTRENNSTSEKIDQTEIELISELMEAYYSKDGNIALDAIANIKYELHRSGIEITDYSEDKKDLFEIMPSSNSCTIRPALVKDGVLLKKGVVAGGNI